MALSEEERKERKRLARKRWRESHPDYEKARRQRYYAKHKERLLAKMKQWKVDHPDYHKQWTLEHPEYYKQWRQAHPGYYQKYREKSKTKPLDKN